MTKAALIITALLAVACLLVRPNRQQRHAVAHQQEKPGMTRSIYAIDATAATNSLSLSEFFFIFCTLPLWCLVKKN
jgi:hypothetical protein